MGAVSLFVIPTYNNLSYLQECITSVLDTSLQVPVNGHRGFDTGSQMHTMNFPVYHKGEATVGDYKINSNSKE